MTGQIPPKLPPPPPMPPKPWYPEATPRPKYRQRVILQEGSKAFKTALDEAVQDGWTIEQIAVNSESNYWMGIVGKI